MASTFPTDFQEVLLKDLKQNYLKKKSGSDAWNQHDTRYFAKGIVKLNAAFTQARENRAINYFSDPVMRSGYLAYFLPVNMMKAYGLLERHNGRAEGKSSWLIADIGAGPLTMTLGWVTYQADFGGLKGCKKLEVHAYEQNGKIVDDGVRLLKKFMATHPKLKNIRLHVKVLKQDLRSVRWPAKHYDWVLSGNFLNELPKREDQERFVFSLLHHATHESTEILLLEPASKKISRDLQALRDAILEKTDYKVVGPCLHQESCPLNHIAKGDWCNFVQQWKAPAFIQAFDQITKLKKEYLLHSYLYLQNGIKAPAHNKSQFLAISNAIKGKGRFDVIGCGPAGRVRFIRSNSNRSEKNEKFSKTSRGDLFSVPEFHPAAEFELDRNVNMGPNHSFVVKK